MEDTPLPQSSFKKRKLQTPKHGLNVNQDRLGFAEVTNSPQCLRAWKQCIYFSLTEIWLGFTLLFKEATLHVMMTQCGFCVNTCFYSLMTTEPDIEGSASN